VFEISRFRAAYESSCDAEISPTCSGDILEGDEAGYVNGDLACEDCVTHAAEQNEDSVLNVWARKIGKKKS
jgi:hypothetical protein